ncbi:hypothetical protein BS47DRAFT_1342258 [Hydnum rufescens UP504]|uniref:Uncharacterized protein n=1 Tax=Hydnum rufescens UP504 TaxID=1448309 RepID=A0A9P6DXQ5_9AGAM|nr:hypothetical protein BS47DRAFT_1342258 [Hydnum rufescens UP504]
MDPLTANLLVTEILGFSPQLLLDDLTNIPHNNVQLTVEAVETFLRAWVEKQDHSKRPAYDKELEEGLAALQTLLDSHSDRAFDLFEAWAWRNVFEIPPDIPIVMPHHEGLDLTITDEEERALYLELDLARKKLEATKRMELLLTKAVKASSQRRARAEKQVQDAEFLTSTEQLLSSIPLVTDLHHKVSQMTDTKKMKIPDDLPQFKIDPDKRLWEASQSGFLSWMTSRAIEITRGPSDVDMDMDIGDELPAAQFARKIAERA